MLCKETGVIQINTVTPQPFISPAPERGKASGMIKDHAKEIT